MKRLIALILLLVFATPSFAVNDKALHFVAGFGISITVGTWKPSVGFVAGTAAGIGKELYDAKTPPHQASVKDALWATAGAGSAWALWKLMRRNEKKNAPRTSGN